MLTLCKTPPRNTTSESPGPHNLQVLCHAILSQDSMPCIQAPYLSFILSPPSSHHTHFIQHHIYLIFSQLVSIFLGRHKPYINEIKIKNKENGIRDAQSARLYRHNEVLEASQ
ncbi:hypothetical protein DID88_007440 [Monilinia fructigena]|uniref:Uncharacterized protein n=1 Tax=Monilinia fructigena TaxID=38457 RepID=A0A395J892_9HELO|nr:hypothetical protein DID88_007440 [Monilinia fructigena]